MNPSTENQNNKYMIKLVFDSVLGAFPLEGSAEFRPTDNRPTKRNITGMIGAAMGVFLEERNRLLEIDRWYNLYVPIRVNQTRILCTNAKACSEECRKKEEWQYNEFIYTDFQTVHAIHPGFPIVDTMESWKRIGAGKYRNQLLNAKGDAVDKTLLIRKQYVQNPYVYAYLIFPEPEHGARVAEYLKNPLMPLYFGRKNCSFARPIFEKGGTVLDGTWSERDFAAIEGNQTSGGRQLCICRS